MSKRKVVAGGYEESSDGPEPETILNLGVPMKKAKSGVYAPLRMSAGSSKGGTNTFQLPRSASSLAQASAPPGPSPFPSISQNETSATLQLPRTAPGSQSDLMILDAAYINSGNDGSALQKTCVDAGMTLKHQAPVVDRGAEPTLVPTKLGHGRSTIAMERQLNEMRHEFDEYKVLNNAQHTCSQQTLALILETVRRLETVQSATSSTPDTLLTAAPVIADVKPYLLSNPAPTPQQIQIIHKVVSKTQYCVGKKKGGLEENSMKEHTRTTWYGMLGILASRAIEPHYEDEFGKPDTLPSQFVDPKTNYCYPKPHWKAPLTKQPAWVPTLILRFCSTIPNNQSKISNTLRALSDEQIIILLLDGPFKTAQTVWRDMKKTDQEIQAMRAQSRKYHRTKRAIPSLRNSEWEYLSNPGYMSQDDSNDKGGLVTKRPDYQSHWVTNVYEAIHNAQLDTAKSQHSLCPQPLQRRIKIVSRPLPHLERGTGSSKAIVCIAICGISKSWREKYPSEMNKSAHLINTKAVVKPDIDAFLSKYPMPNTDSTTNGPSGSNDDEDGLGLAMQPTAYGDYSGDDGSERLDKWQETSRGVNGNSIDDRMGLRESEQADGLGAGVGTTGNSDIPIDPALPPNHSAQSPGFHSQRQLGSAVVPSTSFSSGELPNIPLAVPEPFFDCSSFSHPQMPPPPFLQEQSPTPSSILAPAQDNITGELSNVTKPKRRGRPPGSKNKKKKEA